MDNLPVHFLYPAELFFSKTPYQINTILGSCIAICLFDPVTSFGGMNHYMLPYWNGTGLASPTFGNIAIENLIDKLVSIGCNKSNLKAKIFGGGEVIETKIVQFHIGLRNIEVAQQTLEENKIPILSS